MKNHSISVRLYVFQILNFCHLHAVFPLLKQFFLISRCNKLMLDRLRRILTLDLSQVIFDDFLIYFSSVIRIPDFELLPFTGSFYAFYAIFLDKSL